MSQGSKNDQGKAPLHMIPEEAIIGMAEAFEFGAKKYDKFNYKKGLEFTRLSDSTRRHLLAFLMGEDIDPESGLHHTKHILANAAMLEYMRLNRPEMDDRYNTRKSKSVMVSQNQTVHIDTTTDTISVINTGEKYD